jgi:hypothetical protein
MKLRCLLLRHKFSRINHCVICGDIDKEKFTEDE